MEVRETYYEVYFDGQHQYEGSYEECRHLALHAYDDDLAEMYKVTITEEKVAV
jgi:hypothetical protein